MKNLMYKSFAGLATLSAFVSCKHSASEQQLPNVIYILADDLGYGDLSCFGQQKFKTPNIDKLAKHGLVLTNHYSGSTVSAPSRACLMTGKHTGQCDIRGNMVVKPEGQVPLPAENITAAELFKSKNYATGCFGKWSLGSPASEGDPQKQGFDKFYGYKCQSLAHCYFPYYLWDNNKKQILEGNKEDQKQQYAPYLIHKQVLDFIDQNSEKPFFVYYPSIIPHAELAAPEEFTSKYRGKLLPETSYKGAEFGHPKYKKKGYGSQKECHASFAGMVNLLDHYVGNIVSKLKEKGIYENTIIVFCSDNGSHLEAGADPVYFNSNAKFRGHKRDMYEGGIRTPMIISWPNKIKSYRESDHISAFWDFVPTVSELIGATVPKGINGISYLPTILGEAKQKQHDYLYWEFLEREGKQAVRKGKWKAVRLQVEKGNKEIELYDLSSDIGETKDIASENPEIVKQMKEIMKTARTTPKIEKFKSKGLDK
jgi:arylsulfatase A-like enzyme